MQHAPEPILFAAIPIKYAEFWKSCDISDIINKRAPFCEHEVSYEEAGMKILFQVLVGSENPTRACFPFLQAVANRERGDQVGIVLAGDGVVLIRDEIIDSVIPVGWPPLKYAYEKLLHYEIPIFV